jgi:peptidoglycan/xylan/chitin deacetylase (PgdA/CDA1 family)
VLCYHQIRDWRSTDSRFDRSIITPIAVFAQQMNTLAQQGYHTISPDQLYRYLRSGTPLPSRPILISFDDGSMGQWPNAFPILRAHRFTATFFIMTVTVDKPGGWLRTHQIQALDRSGMTIGIHTWDHHPVTGYTAADWQVQLIGAKTTLEHIVGHPVPWFAYAYGTWNTAALPHLAAGGVLMAFQLAGQNSATMPMLSVRRIMPSPYWGMPTFANQISAQF